MIIKGQPSKTDQEKLLIHTEKLRKLRRLREQSEATSKETKAHELESEKRLSPSEGVINLALSSYNYQYPSSIGFLSNESYGYGISQIGYLAPSHSQYPSTNTSAGSSKESSGYGSSQIGYSVPSHSQYPSTTTSAYQSKYVLSIHKSTIITTIYHLPFAPKIPSPNSHFLLIDPPPHPRPAHQNPPPSSASTRAVPANLAAPTTLTAT